FPVRRLDAYAPTPGMRDPGSASVAGSSFSAGDCCGLKTNGTLACCIVNGPAVTLLCSPPASSERWRREARSDTGATGERHGRPALPAHPRGHLEDVRQGARLRDEHHEEHREGS